MSYNSNNDKPLHALTLPRPGVSEFSRTRCGGGGGGSGVLVGPHFFEP